MKISASIAVLVVMTIASTHLFSTCLTAQEQAQAKTKSSRWLLPLPELQIDSNVPDSETELRYRWGDDISSHYQIETYLKALAQAAPTRTKLIQYGKSYEGRSLNYLVVSSESNIAKLDEIQKANLVLVFRHSSICG